MSHSRGNTARDVRPDGNLPHSAKRLARLVGRWDVTIRWSEATHRLVGGPREVEAEADVSWLKEGRFLHYQLGPAHWIMGGDDDSAEYVALYADERPVSRIYRMTLNRGLWRFWRDSPGFRQPFEGRIGGNGRRIVAHWDKAENEERWVRDFDMDFVRA